MLPRFALFLAATVLQLAIEARAQFVVPTNFVCGVTEGWPLSNGVAKAYSPGYARTGARSVLVLRVDFADAPGAIVNEAQARAEMGSVDAFFRSTSFQQLSLPTVAVTPLLRLPGAGASYANNIGALAENARLAAEAVGFNFSAYDFAIYSFPQIGLGFTALGSIGGKGIWVQGNNFVAFILAHELGHNLGLPHANSWTAPDDSIIGPGFSTEYGNIFDVMGSSPFYPSSDFNANFRYLLGWLLDSDVHLATTSGVYRVFAMDAGQPLDISRRYALRVPVGANFNGALCDYWIDARQALAYDRTTNGILVKAATSTFHPRGNLLLDTTPGTLSRHFDGPLVVGRTFADPVRGIYVTPIRKGSSGDHIYFDVQVSRDVINNQLPTITISASALATNTLRWVSFTAQASDPDQETLSYFWDFGSGSLPSKLNAFQVSNLWTRAGNYLVQCTVSDLKGGVAAHSVVVQIGTPTNFMISGRVLLGATPVQGARVHNNGNAATYRYASTDSDGFYALTDVAPDTYAITAVKPGLHVPVRTVAVGPNAENIDLAAVPVSAPFISAIIPSHGLLGTSVRISGANLSGASSVRFGNAESVFSVLSPTEISATVPAGASTAAITITTRNGTAVSTAPFVLDAEVPLSIVRQPGHALVPEGSNWLFGIEVFGSGPLGFQWQRDGTNIPGAVASTLTIQNVGLQSQGSYSVVVTNPLGSVASAAATLTVLTLGRVVGQPSLSWNTSIDAPWFAQTNVWLDSGGDASSETPSGGYSAQSSSTANDSWIETTVEGPLRLSFWWQLAARFFDESLELSIDGNLAARINGPKNWAQISLTIESGTHVLRWTRRARVTTIGWLTQVRTENIWFVTQPQGATVLAGDPYTLSATSGAAAFYQWQRHGVAVAGATNAALVFPTATPSDAGDYRVVIGNGSSSATSIVAQLEVVPLTITSQPVPVEVTATSNATFSIESTSRAPVTWQWHFGDALIPGATNRVLTFRAMPADAGDYRVVVANTYGAVTSSPASLIVRSKSPEVVGGSSNYVAYTGERVSLQVPLDSIPPPAYQWFRNRRAIRGAKGSVLTFPKIRPAQKGDYVLVAQNPFGVVTQHIQVTVRPFVILQQPTNQDLFVGDTLRLSVVVGAGTPVKYQWRFNGIDINGATNAQFTIPSARLNDAGDFDVVVRPKRGRAFLVSSIAHVTVTGNAPSFISEPQDQTDVRVNEIVVFSSFAAGNPMPAYQWFLNNVPIPFATQPTLRRVWTSNVGGAFFVIASNEFGTAMSRVAQLAVRLQPPTPQISPEDFSTVVSNFIVLRAHDKASPPIESYQWAWNEFGIPGATNSHLILPAITPEQAGKYRVTAINAIGLGTSAGTDIEVRPALALDLWQWSTPLPRADDLRGAAFGNGLLVAAGEAGALLTSGDATDWQDRSLLTPLNFSSLAFAAGQFMVLLPDEENHPMLLVSSNGIDWLPSRLPRAPVIRNICTANDRFFAAGEDVETNLVLCVSDDGNTWMESALSLAATNVSVAYGAGRYIAVAGGRTLISTDATNWSVGPDVPDARHVCFGKDTFVAVGYGGRVLTSSDATEWRLRNSGTGKDLFVAAFAKNRFIAAGEDGRVISSADGLVWSNAVSNTAQELDAFAAGAEQVALFGKGGAIITSSDAVTWISRLRGPTSAGLAAVIFTNDMFVAVGDSGTVLASADGRAWIARESGVVKSLNAIARGPSGFVAVGAGGTIISSSDTAVWIPQPSSPTTNSLNGVHYFDGRYFAVGDAGTILASTNGTNWSSHSVSLPGRNGSVQSVAYGNGLFVAVGGYETSTATNGFAHSVIITSPDGNAWTLQTPDFGKKLRNITFLNGLFFALGNDGLVVSSEDGARWRHQFIAEEFENLRSVRLFAGTLVIVGNNGIVFSSADGLVWKRQRLFTAKNLHDAAYGQNVLVAVGSDGAVLRAEGLLPALSVKRMSEPAGIEFSAKGGMHEWYRLQISEDNFVWRDLHVLTNGTPPLIDTNLLGSPNSFFRLRYP